MIGKKRAQGKSSPGRPAKPKPKSIAELPVEMVSVWNIVPAPENDLLYRPPSATDPDTIALADNIKKHHQAGGCGILEPLVITADHVIASGHRRFAAAKVAGLYEVPCRILEIESWEPGFVQLLRDFNRQRVKSFDEVVREEIVSADPEESYRLLLEHRKQQARVTGETILIEGKKHRCEISAAKKPMLDAVVAVINGLREYWPLSDRRVHYVLLNDPPLRHAKKPRSIYQNDHESYKDLCDLLTRARLVGAIPWNAISDPTRPVVTWDVYDSVGPFVRRKIGDFLKGYYRNLQRTQPNHFEIVGEKNTIDNIIRPVAAEFCIPMTLGRGYCSLDPRHEMCCRFKKSGKEKLIILILSDFDPEGEDIAHSFARSMRDDFGVNNVQAVKVALTAEQVQEMQLPPMMKAKKDSSRHAKFTARHGDNVFELDAVAPGDLANILRVAIESRMDVDKFNAEVDAEKQDAAHLDGLRRKVQQVLLELQDEKK
jgi:hypothetical protein